MAKELLEQMKKLQSQGMSYRAIARELGCGRTSVSRWLDPAIRDSEAKYRNANKAKSKQYFARYRAQHKEARAEQSRRYYVAHREQVHRYYVAHRDEIAARQVLYRAKNIEKVRKGWREKDARRRAIQKEATIGDPAAIARVYDRAADGKRVRCYLCGKLIPLGKRHVDHVVPLAKGGLHTANNLAIACAACNLSKRAKMPDEVGLLL